MFLVFNATQLSWAKQPLNLQFSLHYFINKCTIDLWLDEYQPTRYIRCIDRCATFRCFTWLLPSCCCCVAYLLISFCQGIGKLFPIIVILRWVVVTHIGPPPCHYSAQGESCLVICNNRLLFVSTRDFDCAALFIILITKKGHATNHKYINSIDIGRGGNRQPPSLYANPHVCARIYELTNRFLNLMNWNSEVWSGPRGEATTTWWRIDSCDVISAKCICYPRLVLVRMGTLEKWCKWGKETIFKLQCQVGESGFRDKHSRGYCRDYYCCFCEWLMVGPSSRASRSSPRRAVYNVES